MGMVEDTAVMVEDTAVDTEAMVGATEVAMVGEEATTVKFRKISFLIIPTTTFLEPAIVLFKPYEYIFYRF